jgi:hypothetical protein
MTKIELIQEKINNLQEELDELKKPKFKFEYKENGTYLKDNMCIYDGYSGIDAGCLNYGLYRIHKRNAENQLRLNKESNLIGALAEQLDDGWVADWGDIDQSKWKIVFNYIKNKYDMDYDYTAKSLNINYMSRDVAEKICKILNNKEVEL